MMTLGLLVSGCGLNLGQRITNAGTETGLTQSRVLLPDWPKYCREHEAKTPLVRGMDPLDADKLDRHQIDVGNAKLDYCADHYTQLQKLIAQATGDGRT